jgi:translocation and assembly module TamB
MRKILKYTFKILGGLILILLLIVLLVSLLIQTRVAKDKITIIAERQASGFIHGNLQIGRLGGNFFTRLTLENVLLTYEDDTIAHIAEIDVRYNLLSLFNNTVDIHSAVINRPFFYLEQINDSVWNIQEIIKPGEEPTDTADAESININVSSFRLNEGRIAVHSPDTVIPQQIRNLNAELSLYWSEETQRAEVKEFTLATEEPGFELKQLTFNFTGENKNFNLRDFYLQTAQNKIEGRASFQPEPTLQGQAHFETSPLHLREFHYFLPGLETAATPVIVIDGRLEQDSAYIDVELTDRNQSVMVNLASGNLSEFLFSDTETRLNYYLRGNFDEVQLGHWLGNPDFDYFLNGSLSARGEGIDPIDADVAFRASLNESTIENRSFKEIVMDIELRGGNLGGAVYGTGDFGEFRIEPRINDLMGNPSYYFELTTSQLNLAPLIGNDTITSDLNLFARVEGKEFDPKKITARAEIYMAESNIQEIRFDTLVADIHYGNENVQIDSLWIRTGTLAVEASGNYSFKSNSDLRLTVDFDGLEEFEAYIPAEDVHTSGRLEAHVTGTVDTLNLEAVINLNQTRYEDITLEGLQLTATGRIAGTDTLFATQLTAKEILIGDFQLDSVTARVNGNLDSVFVQTSLANSDFNTQLSAGVVPGEKIKITIPEWDIQYKNQHWFMRHPPAYIELDSMNYYIDNFVLVSGDSDSAQYISMQGTFSRQGEEDFQLEIGNLDVGRLMEMLEMDVNASGLADLQLNLTGTSDLPLIDGNFVLRNAEFNNYRFVDFKGNMNYSDQRMNLEALFIPQDSGRFQITAMLPLQLDLDTMGFHFSPDDSLTARVLIEEFPLAVLNSFQIQAETTGYIEGEINVNGTTKAPNPNGNVRLVNASFAMREYGINYRDIRLNVNFLRDRIALDTLSIRSSDGRVTGTGHVFFGSDFYEGDISESEIILEFNRFNPVNHSQFNMQVSGNANLKGNEGEVVFGGDLRIPQAEINLPAVLNLMGRMTPREMPQPILVQELDRMAVPLESLGIMEFERPEPDSVRFDYFDNLKGQLRVRIPRNTWIKNDDMRIEISGELEIIKNADFFELFGTVEVVRGQYELLGRAFVIDEGTINFEGGEELSLRMNIEASYRFRNDRQIQQVLTVNISGTPEKPEVNFKLDDNAIEEGDALSYILFGRSMDELTMSERDNISDAGGGSLAEHAAAALISAQVSSFLQDKLDVDYIEIRSGGGFEEATVVVGKYITNNLFVSYEQRFGETDEHNMKKYEVKLEYQLFRFLFFELNNSTIDSGFDVIFKFDIL